MSTIVTSSCIFDSMSRSSHPHDALDTLMQRLESLGTDNGSTDEDYSFAGQPPALVSTSHTVGGYHGFGSGAGAASVGSGTGEYMLLQSTPLRSGAVGLVNRRSGSGTRASPLGFGSARSGGSLISTRRSNSPSIPLPGSKLFRVTILDNPNTICCGLIGTGNTGNRFCTAARLFPHSHCGFKTHGTRKFTEAAPDTYYCPMAPLRGKPTASTILKIPTNQVHSSLRQTFGLGELPLERWRDVFNDAISRVLLPSPSRMLQIEGDPPIGSSISARIRGESVDEGDMDSTLGSHEGLDDGFDGMSSDGVANPPQILFPWEQEDGDNISEPPSSLRVAFELLRVAIEQCFTDQESYEQSVLARVDSAVASQLGELSIFIARYGSVADAFRTLQSEGARAMSRDVEDLQRAVSSMSTEITRITANGAEVSKEEFLRVINKIITITEQAKSSSMRAVSSANNCVQQVQQLLHVGPQILPPGSYQPPSAPSAGLDGDTTITVMSHGGTQVPVTVTLLYNKVVELERNVQQLTNRSQGGGVSVGKWSFGSESEFDAWMFQLNPQGEGIAAFVDPVSIWHFGSVIGQDAADYLTEAHRNKSVGLKQGEANHVTSFSHRCPAAFAGNNRDGSAILSTTTLPIFEKWENWKGNGTGDGVKERLTQAIHRAVERHEIYVQATGLPDELKELARKTAELTRMFWIALSAYIDDEYLMLTSFNLLPKHVLLLLSTQIVKICDDMNEFRSRGANVDLQDRVAGASRLAWCTLQAHTVMQSYLVQKFRNHPGISGTFVRFLTRHMTDGASTNCGDLDKLEKRIHKLEGEIVQLRQKLGSKASLDEFEKLKTKVEKFMEKANNRNA